MVADATTALCHLWSVAQGTGCGLRREARLGASTHQAGRAVLFEEGVGRRAPRDVGTASVRVPPHACVPGRGVLPAVRLAHLRAGKRGSEIMLPRMSGGYQIVRAGIIMRVWLTRCAVWARMGASVPGPAGHAGVGRGGANERGVVGAPMGGWL